jgi:hypothetical protein
MPPQPVFEINWVCDLFLPMPIAFRNSFVKVSEIKVETHFFVTPHVAVRFSSFEIRGIPSEPVPRRLKKKKKGKGKREIGAEKRRKRQIYQTLHALALRRN